MRRLRREGNVPGHGPQKGHHFSRQSHHVLIGVRAASQEWSIALAQADLRLPTEVLDGVGQLF